MLYIQNRRRIARRKAAIADGKGAYCRKAIAPKASRMASLHTPGRYATTPFPLSIGEGRGGMSAVG